MDVVEKDAASTRAQRGHPAAAAGLVFCALYLASYLAVRGLPDPAWSNQQISSYYTTDQADRLRIVALYAVPFAGIAFLWFLAAFRDQVARLAGNVNTTLATVQMLSGAAYVTLQFCPAAALASAHMALADAPRTADVTGARPVLFLGNTILIVFALRAAGVFMAAGTTRALRAGMFPKWFAVVSYVLAIVLMFTADSVRGVVLIFPLWIGVVSAVILIHRPRMLAERTA